MKFLIAVFTFIIGVLAGAVFVNYDLLERFLIKEKYIPQSEKLPEDKGTASNPFTVKQLFNIDTTTVKKMFLYKTISTYGDLYHPETDIKDITFKIDGYVEKLYGDFTGKYVKKGQPLLSVYSPELISAQEEFLRAYQYLKEMEDVDDPILKKSAEDMYTAAYKKLLYWDIPPHQIEKLKKTKKVLKSVTLYSPYDGWIMEKFVYLGSKVKAGEPIMRIAKHEKLWLILKIYERDISFVREGQKVLITFESYPDRSIEGKIDYIYPMLNEKNRTLDVRVVVDNRDNRFFPGMYGRVYLKIPLGEKLVLPETAVINTGKKQVVFIEKKKGIFQPVYVKLGIYADGFYEIKEGLHEGMVVANSSLFLLDADAQLRGLYKKEKNKHQMMHMHHH